MKTFSVVRIIMLALLIASCGSNKLPPGGSGLVESTEVIISAESSGQLKVLHFREGDLIEIDDTIGVIDTITVMLGLRQTEAAKNAAQTQLEMAALNKEQAAYNFDLAEKEFKRISSLIKSGSANRQQYDKAENTFNQASLARKQAAAALNAAEAGLARIEAEVALLRKRFDDCFPTSPLSGRITNEYVDVGELVAAGKPLIKIARFDTVWVKVYLPPSDLTRIKLGDLAEIDPEDGRETPLEGYIGWISSQAEFTPKNVQTKEARADLVYAVKIIIPNPQEQLKIGMPVSVTIP
ncbi:MAG: efflux RND transporter periplasmic adaptor subunit [Candidatus Zixiibacteriota bacterium]|nr:MAG: efflux RND transporter periplasmic adaptor subunit [candidate division Zixibacteria bacterium]